MVWRKEKKQQTGDILSPLDSNILKIFLAVYVVVHAIIVLVRDLSNGPPTVYKTSHYQVTYKYGTTSFVDSNVSVPLQQEGDLSLQSGYLVIVVWEFQVKLRRVTEREREGLQMRSDEIWK